MADEPYKTLGISRIATAKQIRTAFLKLAKTTHPDLNPGDPKAEERFKAINAAYDLISDPDRRARFDRGEIDAAGHEPPPPRSHASQSSYRSHAEGPGGSQYGSSFGGEDEHDLGDILSGLFGGRARHAARRESADRHYTLAVSFLDAVRGTTQRLVLPEGGTLDVRIPAGLTSGQVLRLRGKGGPGPLAGDALVEVDVASHPLFRRQGRDIELDLPITVAEAVVGARVTVPTINGPVSMTVPAGSEAGTRLRLRGRGVPASGTSAAGDGYATLQIVLGPPDAGLANFLRDRTDAPDWNPRLVLENVA